MTLRLFFDEDVDPTLVIVLARDGLDVLTTRDAGRSGRALSDDDQLRFAASTGRAIFTHNTSDYVRLSREWAEGGVEHFGIIVSAKHPLSELRRRFHRLARRYPEGMANLFDFL